MEITQNLLILLIITFNCCLITARITNSMYPLLQTVECESSMENCNFDRIYQLGDSLSDTGNIVFEPAIAFVPFAHLPYGENFYQNVSTGRCSDGMLMIDFIARASGLPLLNPYKKPDSDFRHGVNFAVAGATALSVEVLANFNIPSFVTSSSLNVQLDWMSEYFNSTCQTKGDCAELHRSSLFMVGEVGGNDMFYALQTGKSIDEVRNILPVIVQTIQVAVQRVIHIGAARIVVSGNFPIGCLPALLTLLQTKNSSAYDENKCLTELNNLATYENELIQLAIKELKQQNPNVTIVYGDYYNAFLWLFHNAEDYGFDVESIQKCCCGKGGDYNFTSAMFCGTYDVPVCAEPSRFMHWDGIHLTQNAYRIIANWIMKDILPQLQCSHSPKRS